jgi:hypothetical protein
MALRKDTKAISPNKTITGKQYVDQIQDLGGKIRWSEANQKPGIAGRVNAVRKEVKEKLSHVAEDQYKDLPAARQAYAQGLVDEDRLTKAASDTTGMRKLVGGEDKLGKTVEFHEALGRSMTDAEYAKYIKDRDFLRTNMQWFKETPIDLPVGTMKAAGAMGAVGLKGTAASNVAETVATGLLRPAKLAGKIMRTGAPVLSTYTNADSDQLMNYLGLPQFATKPVTMNPEEQENQKGIFEILQKLGGRTNE